MTNNSLALCHKINYVYIAYLIVWSTFNRLFLNIDGAGRIGMLLCILSVLNNIGHWEYKRTFKSFPILLWFVWCIYVSIVWIYKGIISVPNLSPVNFLFSRIFVPWYAMFLTCYEMAYNPKNLSKLLVLSFAALCTLGYLSIGSVNIEDRTNSILGNEFVLSSLAMVFIASFSNIEGFLKKKWVIALCILSLACILSIQTRKAFAGVIILLASWIIAIYERYKPHKIIKAFPAFLSIYLFISYILNNTKVGERFNDIGASAEIYNTSDIAWLNFLGDRAYFYIKGWNIFWENPICGIGINNFMVVEQVELPIHSEYMVQLCECGIIGSVLFILFYASLLRHIKKTMIDTQHKILFIGYMLCVVFVNFTAWTYQFTYYFICFGIILGYKNTCKARLFLK